jgi:DNA-nicking Smr family endonuclease
MPPRRRQVLTEQDRHDWARFASQIKPLAGRSPLEMPPEPVMPPMTRAPESAAPPPPSPLASTLSVGTHPGGLDNGTWNRFRSGKLAPARTLDLHGRTAQRAFHALESFLYTAHADQIRVVEVITGRGSGESGGVIRREFPLWLNLPTLRPLILAASHPHEKNPGSVRLLLRRAK